MPKLETFDEVQGRPGVWKMYVASSRERCGGSDDIDNLLVSDGKNQWLGHNGKYYSSFTFSTRWVYGKTPMSWHQFTKEAKDKQVLPKFKTRRLLLCDTRKPS